MKQVWAGVVFSGWCLLVPAAGQNLVERIVVNAVGVAGIPRRFEATGRLVAALEDGALTRQASGERS